MWLDKTIHYLEKIARWANNAAQKAAIAIVFGMMVLAFVYVIGRMFSKPIFGTYELIGLGLAMLVFLSIGYTQLHKDHISVGIVVDKLPPRIQAAVDMFIYLIFLVLLILLSWQLAEHASRLSRSGNVTPELGMPMYIFAGIASIGVLFYALVLALDLLKSLRKVLGRNGS